MRPLQRHLLCAAAFAVALVAVPAAAAQTTGGTAPQPLPADSGTPGQVKVVGGKAIPPPDAPPAVRRAIAYGNRIIRKPYRYGGGHASFRDSGYDCSGAISYALRGARVLAAPLPSGPFMRWGEPGPGRWLTVWTNPGHAWLQVANVRLDTGYRSSQAARLGAAPGRGPRWDVLRPTKGFVARHPAGL